MFQGNYINISSLIEDIQRDVEYDFKINTYDVAEWAWKAMDLIGAKTAFEQKEVLLDVVEYRTLLPTDFKSLNAVRLVTDNLSMVPSSDEFFITNQEKTLPMVSTHTYRIDNRVMFFGFKEGQVAVAYNAIKVDSKGFPLIPDETRYSDAVASYIKYKLDHRLFRKGVISQAVYNESKKHWFFMVGSAFTKMVTPDQNTAELMRKNKSNMLDNPNAHNSGFRTMNIETVNKNH
jgi:hypothetical protein